MNFKYKEVVFKVKPCNPWRDILINLLADIGYESFEEIDGGCKAYIKNELFDENKLNTIDLKLMFNKNVKISFTCGEVENMNWNEEWEKNYKPVTIAGKCYIRAPFHHSKSDMLLEIIIEPKMSFGTGHHKTTALIVEFLLETDMKNRSVLDMGCGTGVQAIISKKLGAKKVTAIDNYISACENTIENINNNNVDVKVLYGSSNLLGEEFYDIIIANITKNVLLEDMHKYTEILYSSGILFLSGFLKKDINDMVNKAKILGLTLKQQKISKGWAALKMVKN